MNIEQILTSEPNTNNTPSKSVRVARTSAPFNILVTDFSNRPFCLKTYTVLLQG